MAKGTQFKKYLTHELLDADFAAEFIAAAIEEKDSDYLNQALGAVVKAHGMSQVSGATGLARQAIYKMLSREGNPTLQSVNKLLEAVGLELTVKSKRKAS